MPDSSPATSPRPALIRIIALVLLLAVSASAALGRPTPANAADPTDLTTSIEPTSAWAKTTTEATLWSGWDNLAKEFSKIAANTTLQVIELRGTRAYVYFGGDKLGHPAGNVWIDKAALTDLTWPRWARARQATAIRTAPDLGSDSVSALPKGAYVETTGTTQGRWSQAFYLADGTPDNWVVGWVDGLDLMLPHGDQTEMTSYMLTRSQLAAGPPNLWLKVPYHSQIDGTGYADANCGPTSLAMALEAFGISDTQGNLRAAALKIQGMDGCDDCGTYLGVLAKVVEAKGLRAFNLKDDPDTLHHWTVDEVRAQLQDGHVVIPQVQFRQLPGRETSPYWGDHYIVVTGLSGSSFLYNDPVDSDGRGYGRLITAEQLARAMDAAHDEYADAAFAVGR